jgi:hypothetical protein
MMVSDLGSHRKFWLFGKRHARAPADDARGKSKSYGISKGSTINRRCDAETVKYLSVRWFGLSASSTFLSRNKSAISNQLTVLFSQNKPAISHQPNEHAY